MKREQFTFYRSYYEAMKILPKKEQTAVMLAIAAYALDNEEPKLDGTSAAIFMLVKPTLDAGRRKAMGGNKGTPKKDSEKISGSSKKDSEKISESSKKDGEKEKEGEIEKEVEVEVEVEVENECLSPLPPSKFAKPTLEEVRAYCQERRNNVDPQRFLDHYTSNGWMVGKNPMKDWKAAVRNWEKSEFGNRKNSSNVFMDMLEELHG